MLKNNLTVLLILFTALTVFAEPPEVVLPPVNTEVMETINNPDVETVIQPPSVPHKKTVAKKKLLKKFLLAMLVVLLSSSAVYVFLSLYKVRRGDNSGNEYSEEEIYLDEPEDLNDAIRSFIDKTRWE